MEQTAHLNRTGWSQEETDLLWKEIHAALNEGTPLRGVFDRTGQALGRKPNSVRNYYYMQMREKAARFETRRPFRYFCVVCKSTIYCVMCYGPGQRALRPRSA
jgi:hypothetical protein